MKNRSAIFIGTLGVSDEIRLKITAQELLRRGYHTEFTDLRYMHEVNFTEFDIIVYNRPLEATSKIIDIARRYGKKLIIDQDDDFEAIPKSHVAYNSIGPGNPRYIQSWKNQLEQADLVTISTQPLANKILKHCKRYKVIPNGWSAENKLWKAKETRPDNTVVITWAGTITHRDDIRLALPSIQRAIRKHKNAKIMIGADIEIYHRLVSIEEKRKIFVPPLPYDLYPIIFAKTDIMCVPLVNDEFNRSKSDIKMVECGAAGIPWIASNVLPYTEWKEGGILCDTNDDWDNALNELILSAPKRKQLGTEGKEKAETREIKNLIQLWIDIMENI